MKHKSPPEVAVEITVGQSLVRVRGKRSKAGWNIFQIDGAKSEFLDFRKSLDDARQLAIDCCEPGTKGTYLVTPKT